MDEPNDKLALAVFGLLILGLIFGLLIEDIGMALKPAEEKKYYIEQKPVCVTLVREGQECGLADFEEDYNKWVCETRRYRTSISPIELYHYDGQLGRGCFTRFTTIIENNELFDLTATLDINIFDNLMRYVETVSKTQTVNAISSKEFRIEYRYTCGKSHIVNYIPGFNIPERRFCEWATTTEIRKKYVCTDVNFTDIICE